MRFGGERMFIRLWALQLTSDKGQSSKKPGETRLRQGYVEMIRSL